MTQDATTAQSAPRDLSKEIEKAQSRVADLRLQMTDQEARLQQLTVQQQGATGPAREQLSKAWAQAQHDFNAVQIKFDVANNRLNQLMREQLAPEAPAAFAIPPFPEAPPEMPAMPPAPEMPAMPGGMVPPWADPFMSPRQLEAGAAIGAFVLLLPVMLAFARRIWVRGGSGATAMDLDGSPRLQRIEQAIESIAVEVERIGEAQRFTTKLLSERQPEPVVGRIPPAQAPRREPGTITPH
jgi:hypothetical protein